METTQDRNLGDLYGELGRDEIRVLELCPGTLHEQPRGYLQTISLSPPRDSFGDYDALSYEWGDAADPVDIIVNDRPFQVRRNLFSALQYLQCKRPCRRLWIDAICIKQFDHVEKGRQVSRMSTIFSLACCTYMWLGNPTKDSSSGMDLIQEDKCSAMDLLQEYSGAVSRRKQAKIPNILAQGHAVKSGIFQRSYWTRIWVVQEALCSRHAIVKCGFKEVDLMRFRDAWRSLPAELHDGSGHGIDATQAPYLPFIHFPFGFLLDNSILEPQDAGLKLDDHLFYWLQATPNFSSTVPRDRIYALLSLTSNEVQETIEVDYSDATTDQSIFVRVTSALLLTMPRQNALELIDLRPLGSRLDLPSWVPNWDTIQPELPVYPRSTSRGKQGFCSGQEEKSQAWLFNPASALSNDTYGMALYFRVSDDLAALNIRALLVDRVADSFTVMSDSHLPLKFKFPGPFNHLYSAFYDQFHAWQARILRRPHNPYRATMSVREILLRTVMFVAEHEHCEMFSSILTADEAVKYPAHHAGGWQPEHLPQSVWERCIPRSLIITDRGYVGVAPWRTLPGDSIWISPHARTPIVLRKEGNHYTWIGGAYVYGLMSGQGMHEGRPADVHTITIR